MKIRETATIISQECLCPGVFSMWIKTGIAKEALAGQFISVYSNNAARLLPRPISICEIDRNKGMLRIVYRIAGAGTEEFSRLGKGDTLAVLGPNGNGFIAACKKEIGSDDNALLIGGGIGIPPMLELSKSLTCKVTTVAGYRSDKDMFLLDDLKKTGTVYVATDDGSAGTHGTVIDAINANNIGADVIFACGPGPMLRGVKELGKKLGIPTYISMEERMACGVGACLGCVVTSTDTDDHSKVNNKRVCADGPVFDAMEVEP